MELFVNEFRDGVFLMMVAVWFNIDGEVLGRRGMWWLCG